MSTTTLSEEIASTLNRDCFCITLDRAALEQALRQDSNSALSAELLQARPNLFSSTAMFLASPLFDSMQATVRAIEETARLPAYRQTVLSWASPVARYQPGPLGVFMGYDFHLAANGPRLIEINTNAGGAFLNAALAGAQRACCDEMQNCLSGAGAAHQPDAAFWTMFLNEWHLQGRSGMPKRVAIVDDRPQEQYLYPEFQLAQAFFQRHGVEAVIADAADLTYDGQSLTVAGTTIDMVYNRLVDFTLEAPAHDGLLQAFMDQAVVMTPHPGIHALFADKRNLTLLGDPAVLRSWGVGEQSMKALGNVLHTELVTEERAESLWTARRHLFFKPVAGYGSKAVYRGEKLTRGVWAEILKGGYVAQEFAPPSERMIALDGHHEPRKVDIRLYTYDGQVLLTAARLYQGQVTNFRTPGGGFAPVFRI